MMKQLSIIVLMCFALKMFPQEAKLIVPGFHTAIVYVKQKSSDNAFFVTGSSDHTLKIWDFKKGKLLAEFAGEDDFRSALFIENNTKLIANDLKNWYVIDLRNFSVLKKGAFPKGALVYEMSLGSQSNTFIYGYKVYDTKTFRIVEFNYSNGTSRPLFEYEGKSSYSNVNKVSISEDKKDLLVLTRDANFLYNFSSGEKKGAPEKAFQFLESENILIADQINRKLSSFNIKSNTTNWTVSSSGFSNYNSKFQNNKDVYYDPFSKKISFSQSHNKQNRLTIINAVTGNSTDVTVFPRENHSSIFSLGDEIFTLTYDPYFLQVWDKNVRSKKRSFGEPVFPASYIEGRPGANTFGLVTFYKKHAKVVDIRDSRLKLRGFATEKGNRDVKVSSDGATIYSGSEYHKGEGTLWQKEKGARAFQFSILDEKAIAVDVSGDGTKIGFLLKDAVKVYDTKSGSILFESSFPNEMSTYPSGQLVFAENDRFIITYSSKDSDNKVKCFSSKQKKMLWDQTLKTSTFSFENEHRVLVQTYNGKTIRTMDAATGNTLSSKSYSGMKIGAHGVFNGSHSVFVQEEDKNIGVYSIATGSYRSISTGLSGELNELFLFQDHFLFSTSTDPVLRLWDIRDGRLLAKFVFFDDNEWVMVTPEGRFDGTQAGIEKLYFVKGETIIELEQLYEKYFTPGLLAQLLDRTPEIDPGPKPLPDVEDLSTPPVVTMSYKESSRNLTVEDDDIQSIETLNPQAIITVNARASGSSKVAEVILYHNGKRVGTGNRNLVVEDDVVESNMDKQFNINLLPGENLFKAIALNTQRTESAPSKLIVTLKEEAKPVVQNTGGLRLHMIVVGIDVYKNKKYNLNYAVADAGSFKEQIENGAQNITSAQQVTFIKNDEAVRETIKSKFQEIASQANPQDLFVFYYAGHGVMSQGNDSDFYLVPYDVTQLYGNDGALKQKGISAKELKAFAAEIPAQKQLYILDACQSAGALQSVALRGAAEEKAIAQLARSTGTHWLTASGSDQFATEFDELGHGVFTYVLLEALSGKADSGDKRITVNELKAYVETRVPEVSQKYKGSPQYPSSFGFGQDFPVSVYK